MDEIIKFLKSFGLGDQEIQKVLKEIPVEQTGLMGTNVATGVFLKGGKKEMSQLPLIVEKITNPFEVNFYKGKPRDEVIKTAEAGIKYLDEEIKKTADLILNKNLQLTQEQKINFAKNLEVKRKFEKDLEDFKTKPEAEVLDIKTKEKIKDVEKLKEESGLMAPPTTPLGGAQLKLKQVEQGLKDILKNQTNIDDILKDPIESQIRYAQLQRSGLVRAVAREIIEQDLKAGKLKLRPEVEKGMISPTGSGLDGDPIEVYRLYYGEDALEQLDSLAPEFNKSYTAKDAAQIARERYPNIQPREKPIREYLTPNEIDAMTKNNPPEEFAKGGSVESKGLDYLMGMERNYPGRSNFEKGTVPRMLKFLIDKLAEEKDFNRKLLERANPKAVQDLYISKYGKLPSAEEIKKMVNKELQGKYSMETVNPKTGEVTTPKEPVTVAQKYDEDIIKAADEIYPSYDDPRIAADQIVDSYAQMKYGLEDQYGLSNKERMDLYRQAYDYVMDYNRGAIGKAATKSIDISDEATAKAFTDFARENDPEGFKKIQKIIDDLNNKNALEQFDIKNREPNAKGGRIGYAEGSDGAPSITLDSHDKAPANMDKYPVKVGNLELGIMGAMSSGKSTPNPYVKVNTADRNISVRGRYNVPDTGVSLVGDIGDIRMRNTQNINVPQYNYKESIRDVMRLNPYSVGIEYAPDQNRNINLRYDNQGNVTLRGEARFAKGGLGYLMGE